MNIELVILMLILSTCQYGESIEAHEFNHRQSVLLQSGFSSIIWQFIHSVDLNTLHLTHECAQTLQSFNKSIELGQDWPLKLIEASGRVPSDFTGFGYLDVGNYDQCLGLSWSNNNESESGQHCLVSIDPVNRDDSIFTRHKYIYHEGGFSIKIGFCLPSSCSLDDINRILREGLAPFAWKVVNIDSCQTEESIGIKLMNLPMATKISSLLLLIPIIMCVACTLIVCLFPNKRGICLDYFSLQSNSRATFCPKINSLMSRRIYLTEMILHFVVLAFHSFVWPTFNRSGSIYGSHHPMTTNNGSGWINIIFGDSFMDGLFLVPAIKHCYQLWSSTTSQTSCARYIDSIVTRVIRTSLTMGLIVTLEMVVPLFADGPFASSIARHRVAVCSSTWYSNIIYTQNTYPYFTDMCAPHTWSIAAELKLSLGLFALIYIYKSKPTVGLFLNLGLVTTGLLYVGSLIYLKKLEPHGIINEFNLPALDKWIGQTYLPTLNHVWIYFIPVLCVYMISRGIKLNLKPATQYKWIILQIILGTSIFLLPAIWKPLADYKTPLAIAIYSILYRLITIIFYFICFHYVLGDVIFFHINHNQQSEKPYKTDCPSEGTEATVPPRNKIYLQSDSRIDKLILTTIIILRATYYVHASVLFWYYSSHKWPIFSLTELIGHMGYAMVLSILIGIVFHLTILGPYLSFIVTLIRPASRRHVNNRLELVTSSRK